MRTFTKMSLALGLVALLVAPAQAQQGKGQGRGFGFGGGMGGPRLVANKGVQKELKASDEQASKLDTLADQLTEKQREAFQGLGDLSPEQRREKGRELSRSLDTDLHKGLGNILSAEQVKRFDQIQVQAAGVNAFQMSRVEAELKLTGDQKSKIEDIVMDQGQSMREIFQSTQGDREAATKKMTELRKQGMEKALAALTDDQKKAWKELTGEPFEVTFQPPRRPNN
jgi:Spy/CpxP family protein refolding chaperone